MTSTSTFSFSDSFFSQLHKYFGRVCCLALAAALLCALPVKAAEMQQGTPVNRITMPLSESPLTQLSGNVPGRVRVSTDQGRLEGSTVLSGITLVFKPSATQQAALDELLAAQQDPTSTQYHQWLTPEQYADSFGLSTTDLLQVSTWLQSQGLTVSAVAPSRNSITVSGTAVQVEQAFQTEIHSYLYNGETHYANSKSPSLPQTLAGMVASIQGLHNFSPKPHLRKQTLQSVSPKFTSSESGSHYISPADFATIYNVAPLYTSGYHGEGIKIAVIGQTAVYTNDLTAFRTAASLPTLSLGTGTYVTSLSSCTSGNSSLCMVCVSANSSFCNQVSTSDLPEADLDLELSSGVAYNANVLYIYDPQNDVFNAYDYAITHNAAPIVSISYGECEDYEASLGVIYNENDATAFRVYTQEGNAQGQTTIAAAGDDGAADCDYTSGSTADNSAIYGLQVDIPADIPEVTGMGGTEFSSDLEATCVSGGCLTNGSANTAPSVFTSTAYWSGTSTSSDTLSSALSYMPEDVWNDNSITVGAGAGFSATGGGISQIFGKPTWQVQLTTSADTTSNVVTTQRDVPDLSLSASPNHDGYLLCTQNFGGGSGTTAEGSSCTSGFRYGTNGSLTVYGGTSVAAPSFAGILALMEQQNSTSYGNLNPFLYALAGGSTTYAQSFHDIQQITSNLLFGANTNDDPCTAGKQNCPSGGVIGFPTLVGYDLATGLGSVNAASLALNAKTLTPSTVTITTSPTNVTTATGTVTIYATVASTSSSVTTTPTGTVTFTVNGTVLASNIPLSGGVASATTGFPNGGAQTVTATYSGSTTYIGSATTSTINVAASGTAPTSVSVTTNPTTAVTMGQTLTLNTTVSSTTTGNITGVVVYKIGTTQIAQANVTAATTTTGRAAAVSVAVTTAQGFTANSSNTITATYEGDATYATSSNSTSITVNGAPTFSVTSAPMTITSTSNGSVGTTTITLTSVNGYSGTIYTPCTYLTENNISVSPNTLDLYYNCSSTINGTTTSQVSLSPAGTATFPLTFQLNTAAGAQSGPTGNVKRIPVQTSRMALYEGGAALAGVLLFSLGGLRRRRIPLLICLLLFGMVFAASGCGSSTSNVNSQPTSGINTAGTYTVTVVMEDTNSLTEQTSFTLTIQ